MFEPPYQPEHPEGPEAKLARETAAAEKRAKEIWEEQNSAFWRLVESLTPEDLTRDLITFGEIREYNLRRDIPRRRHG